jgi:hypothetical protein
MLIIDIIDIIADESYNASVSETMKVIPMRDVHAVSLEQAEPTWKDIGKAFLAAATGDFRRAKFLLAGESKLIAKDANGEMLFAVSGGRHMTVVTDHRKSTNAPAEEPARKCNRWSL